MTSKTIQASVTTTENFGPREQSRDTSKASTLHQLGVSRRRSGRRKALAEQILDAENSRIR